MSQMFEFLFNTRKTPKKIFVKSACTDRLELCSDRNFDFIIYKNAHHVNFLNNIFYDKISREPRSEYLNSIELIVLAQYNINDKFLEYTQMMLKNLMKMLVTK